MKKTHFLKLIKYVTGSVISVLVATALGLNYAYSAGIIVLLTIQDTRKKTLHIALKRIVVFFGMTLLSTVIFPVSGYHVWAFGILLIPYLIGCMTFDLTEAITPIAVLCTHYIAAGDINVSIILNEFLILTIGTGIGIFVNLFMPDGLKPLVEYQRMVDDKIVNILNRMAVYMECTCKTGYTGDCFDELDELLLNLKKEAMIYMNNHFMGENDYYYEYMQMRARQCNILKRIYSDIIRLTELPKQVKPLTEFICRVADEFEEKNDACNLLNELEELRKKYSIQELPKTREEFENRAMLYHILEDFRTFLEIKSVFAGKICTFKNIKI